MNGKDLLKQGMHSRYVIDLPMRDETELSPYPELVEHLKARVFPFRKAAAEKEQSRNAEVVGTKRRINHHHQNFFKRWWALSYARHDLIRRLCKCRDTLPVHA